MRKHKFMRKLICITHAAHCLYISCALIHSLVHELKCLVLNVIFHLLTNHLFFSQANNFLCYPVKKGIHLFYMSIICLISTIHPHITHKITFPFLIYFKSEIFSKALCHFFAYYAFCSCSTFPTAPAYSFHSSFCLSNSFLPFFVIL